MKQECATCKFWLAHERRFTTEQGSCRRYPPTVILQSNHERVASFPTTEGSVWCGEWGNFAPGVFNPKAPTNQEPRND